LYPTEIGSFTQVTSREIVAATPIASHRFFLFEAVKMPLSVLYISGPRSMIDE
jgi:hypothetical protein